MQIIHTKKTYSIYVLYVIYIVYLYYAKFTYKMVERKYRIRELTQERGISLMDLSKAIDKHYGTVSTWSGIRSDESKSINPSNIALLAKFFGVPPNEMITEVSPEVIDKRFATSE